MRALAQVLFVMLSWVGSALAQEGAAIGTSQADWQRAQEALIWLGYYSGPLDGEPGPATNAAIEKYRQSHKIASNLALTPDEIAQLVSRGARLRQVTGFSAVLDSVTGIRAGIPKALIAGPIPKRDGSDYATADQSIHLALRSYRSAKNLDDLFKQLKDELSQTKIIYEVLKPDFFVIAGESADYQYYLRYHQRERSVAGFQATYRRFQSAAFRSALTMLSLTLQPFAAAPRHVDGNSRERASIELEGPLSSLKRPGNETADAVEPVGADELAKSNVLIESIRAYLSKYPQAKFYRYIIKKDNLPGFATDVPLLRVVFDQRLFFDTARSEVKAEGGPTLRSVAEALRAQNGESALFVAGHADYRGGDEYNLDLSIQRAESAARFLLSLGVGRTGIWRVGFGKTVPLRPNNSDDNMSINRRVEFLVATRPAVLAMFLAHPEILCDSDPSIDCGGLKLAKGTFKAVPVLPVTPTSPDLETTTGTVKQRDTTLPPARQTDVETPKQKTYEINVGAKTYQVGRPVR